MLISTRFAAIAAFTLAATLPGQTPKTKSPQHKVAVSSGYRKVATWDLHATGLFDYLTPSPADHRLYIAQDHQVIVVDTTTGNVIHNFTSLAHVHGVVLSKDGKTGYISDGVANKIVIFDTGTLNVTGEIPTEGSNPDSQVIDPSSGHLFTFNGKSQEGVAIDLAAGKVIAHFSVPGKPEFSQADGEGHVFVNIETTSQLLRIDAATNKVINTWKLTGCEGPSGLDIDRANHRLFSVCDGKMAVTDSTTGRQIALVPIGDGPDAVWYDAERKLIFASNGGPGTLSIVRQVTPDSYSPVQSIATSKGARTMAYDSSTHTAYVISVKGTPVAAQRLSVDVIAK